MTTTARVQGSPNAPESPLPFSSSVKGCFRLEKVFVHANRAKTSLSLSTVVTDDADDAMARLLPPLLGADGTRKSLNPPCSASSSFSAFVIFLHSNVSRLVFSSSPTSRENWNVTLCPIARARIVSRTINFEPGARGGSKTMVLGLNVYGRDPASDSSLAAARIRSLVEVPLYLVLEHILLVLVVQFFDNREISLVNLYFK